MNIKIISIYVELVVVTTIKCNYSSNNLPDNCMKDSCTSGDHKIFDGDCLYKNAKNFIHYEVTDILDDISCLSSSGLLTKGFEKTIPSFLDGSWTYENYESFRALKNRAKDELTNKTLPADMKASFQKVRKAYHNFVANDPSLNRLKELRRFLKFKSSKYGKLEKSEKLSILNVPFKIAAHFHKFVAQGDPDGLNLDTLDCRSDDFIYELKLLQGGLINPELNGMYGWNDFRMRYIQPLVSYHGMRDKEILWLTGSKSSSLPMMKRVSSSIDKPLSLMSTGMLLDGGFTPLCGEAVGCNYFESESHKSYLYLSGVPLKLLGRAWEYSSKTSYAGHSKEKLEKKLENEIEGFIRDLNSSKKDEFNNENQIIRNCTSSVFRIQINLLQMLYVHGISNEKHKILKQKIELILKLLPPNVKAPSILENSKKTVEQRLYDILESLDTVEVLDNDDKEIVESPFPVIWGSTTIDSSRRLDLTYYNVLYETVVKGPLFLGSDIQLAFTDYENIERLKGLLSKANVTGVEVMPIDIAFHARNAIDNEM
jgi:hypothetical protein